MRAIVEDFTDVELYDIMYDYIVIKKPIKEIHQLIPDRCSLGYLHKVINVAIHNQPIMRRVLCKLMSRNEAVSVVKIDNYLGSKKESYYKSEEDVLWNTITFNDLSESEKSIYYGVD